MKLKLSTKPAAAPPGEQAPSSANAAPPPGSAGGKLKIKFGSQTPVEGQAAEPPKQKRKYTKKPKFDEHGNPLPPGAKTLKIQKRPRDQVGDGDAPTAKRKIKPTAKSLELVHSDDSDMEDNTIATVAAPSGGPVRQGSKIKLKVNSLKRTNTALALKIKGFQGRPPVRPPGVGYDSEAEEAEEDPAIESQFVLRMQPGPDCDLLRKAIEEKKIGKPSAEGGTMVVFRFFDPEGRRALINIQNRLYAAAMVDLPCVIESMKSWNKKDWVKTADVCQMLLVLGRVANEEEAKKFPLPPEVHPHKHQYPHGLTPPMHWVRRRRFRPRQSYHEIEQREAMVNQLLAADESARSTPGGNVEYEIIDENRVETDEETSDEDGEGEEDIAETTEQYVLEGGTPGGEEIEVDNDLAAALAAGLMEDEDVDVDALFGNGGEVEAETPVTSHDVAVHALGENAVSTPETAATSPNAATSPDDDDDDDDDAESAQEDEMDAQAAAAQEGLEQGMTEIRELEQEITKAQEQLESSNNVLYKQRCKRKIEQLQTDLGLKKAALGLGDDGD